MAGADPTLGAAIGRYPHTLALHDGRATWVGNPREALIVLPGPLKVRYERTQT